MKPKTMILMVVAVTCGLGASYMTSRLLAERGDAPEIKKVPILVAKKNLNMGEILKNPQDFFETKEVTEGEEPKGAISTAELEKLKNRQLMRSLRTGDHITQEDMFDGKNGGIAYSLPEGYRAYGIRVNIQDIAGGFASLPQSRVDVISTVRGPDDKSSYSMLLLEDILVLAADTNTGLSEGGKAMPATVVTVAVTDEQMLRLSLAKEHGPLSLALRRFNDKHRSDIGKLNMEQVKRGFSVQPGEVEETPKVTQAPPKETPKVVEPKVEPTAEVVAVAPKYTKHRVTIVSGDKVSHQDYYFDEGGNVVPPEVANAPQTQIPQVPRPANDKRTEDEQ